GLWANLIGFLGTVISGDLLAKVMTEAQPMKMAAAEAMYNTASGADASFSIFTLGTPDGVSELFSIRIPYLTAFLASGNLNGTVEGINDLQAKYAALYCGPDAANALLTCPTDNAFVPIIWVTYWAFRWMIGLGALAALVSIVGLWVTRRGREPRAWMWRAAVWSAPLPMIASLVGWIFTEMGRQPWLVFGLMTTKSGVSPIPGIWVLISLLVFTAVYGALAVVEFKLITRAAQAGPPDLSADADGTVDAHALTTVY
ncbi:MAG: cytochrome ubiquinol oxidase subunit I, partial [Agromyces sp.]